MAISVDALDSGAPCSIQLCLEQQQAFARIEQIDSTLRKFDGQSVVIKMSVVTPKTQSKATLAV